MDELDTRGMLESVGGQENAQGTPESVTKAEPIASGEKEQPWWSSKIKDEVEYTANGKPVKESLEMILKRASQGYNYAQHMEELNKKTSEFETNRQKWEQIDNKWKPYEDFSKQNPEYNKFLEEQWNKRESWKQGLLSDPDNPMTPVVLKLQEQIESLKNDFGSKFQNFEAQKEDSVLDKEINSVKTKFNDIDFDQRDELGKSLEFRVMEHATKNGIRNFEAAFKDFHHDELIKRAESRTKEQMLNESRNKKAQGIIGGKPTPGGAKNNSSFNPKNMSYDQLSKLALDELASSGMN